MSRKLNIKDIIIRSNKIHNNNYDYSEVVYINCKEKVKIICKKHGSFLQTIDEHLSGCGCFLCGLEKRSKKKLSCTEKFIEKANKIHNYKYDYSKTVYTKAINKVNIICKNCSNEFLQTANSHLSNHGCPFCFLSIGFKKTSLEKVCKNKNKVAKLYLVNFYSDVTNENFYKIGLTTQEVTKRFKRIPYKIKEFIIYANENSEIIYNLEKKLLKDLKLEKYKPLLSFGGCGECLFFKDKVLETFKNYTEKELQPVQIF